MNQYVLIRNYNQLKLQIDSISNTLDKLTNEDQMVQQRLNDIESTINDTQTIIDNINVSLASTYWDSIIFEFINLSPLETTASYLIHGELKGYSPELSLSKMPNSITQISFPYIVSTPPIMPSDISYMFANCSNITSINASALNTANNISYLFYNCKSLRYIDMSNFNSANLTKATNAFKLILEGTMIHILTFIAHGSLFKKLASISDSCFTIERGVTLEDDIIYIQRCKISSNGVSINKYANSINWSEFQSMLTVYDDETITIEDNYYVLIDYRNINENPKDNPLTLSSNTKHLIFGNELEFSSSIDYLFNNCSNLESITMMCTGTKITSCDYMFNNCTSLKSINLSNFNPSIIASSNMFQFENNTILNIIETINLNSFKGASLKSTRSWFENLSKLKILELNSFSGSGITDISRMFYNCNSLSNISLPNFTGDSVNLCDNLIDYCNSLEVFELPNFVGNNILNDTGLFNLTHNIVRINMGAYVGKSDTLLNIANLINLDYLNLHSYSSNNIVNLPISGFCFNCPNLSYLNLHNFTARNITDWQIGTTKAKQVDISNLNPNNMDLITIIKKFSASEEIYLTNIIFKNDSLSELFQDFTNLKKVDISNISANDLHDISYMFNNCPLLTMVDLSHIQLKQMQNMSYMFNNCYSLTNVLMPILNNNIYIDMERLFKNCRKIKYIDMTNVNNLSYRYDEAFLFTNDLSNTNQSCIIIANGFWLKNFIQTGIQPDNQYKLCLVLYPKQYIFDSSKTYKLTCTKEATRTVIDEINVI